MRGCIASPHWDACETCKFYGKNGCDKAFETIELSLYLGDWILCEDYEDNPALEPTDTTEPLLK